MGWFSRWSVGAFAAILAITDPAAAATTLNLNHMRAAHMAGNYAGNLQGIKTAVAGPFDDAPTITVGSTAAVVARSSFTSNGVTFTNDLAQVTLTNVTVGSTTYAKAGFWIGRDVNNLNVFIQFRPSFDSNLAAISGFARDITFSLMADGKTTNDDDLAQLSGPALAYVKAVIKNGASLVQKGSYVLTGSATLDQAAAATALTNFVTPYLANDQFFQYMKDEHVEWLGLSVAIFYDSISDPTVKLEYKPSTNPQPRIYTFDDADLSAFIQKAKQQGFKVYLTLAFEPGGDGTLPGDANCHTSKAKIPRYHLGDPVLDQADPRVQCINTSDWWWAPSHPSYAANVKTFFDSYTQVAVKYAQLSQQTGVDLYSIGTETEPLFRTRAGVSPYTNNFRTQLTQMVTAVRAVYSGLVTYDQHYSSIQHPEIAGGTESTSHVFADLGLDVVGVSAYFELMDTAPTAVLPVSQFETIWDNIFKTYLVPLQAANPGKPIVFTEFGYTDDIRSPNNQGAGENDTVPTRDANGSTPGMRQQQNLYQAFFNIDERYNNLVKGAFDWDNEIFTGTTRYCTTVGWNFYCKSIGDTIKTVYARWQMLETAAAARAYAGEIFSTAQATSQSFLRFFNTGTAAGTVAVALHDPATGQVVGNWTSPSIAAGSEQQFFIGSVEAGLTTTQAKPAYYVISTNTAITGYFQHVLYRPADGTLTNLSTCAGGATADPSVLSGVHSSLLGAIGFPSSVVVANTGSSARAANLGIYNAADGTKLTTTSTALIPAGAQVVMTVANLESAAGLTPPAGAYHYVIRLEGTFTGFLQHLVNNTKVGVVTDMTTACTLSTAPPANAAAPMQGGAVFSTAQSASQSFLRFFNTGASAGAVTATLRNPAGQAVAQWTSPTIAAGAEQQFFIGALEGSPASKPDYYTLSVQSGLTGSYQHVLYRPADGTLTNLSTCATGVTSDAFQLSGVHTSLIGGGFPSTVVVNNTASAAATVTLGVYDARDGTKLGTYTTPSIAAGGQANVMVADIETGARITPSGTMYHYVVKAEGTFSGFLQHLVNNTKVGVITDMTTSCAVLPGP